jgi:hypothetical protein
VLGSFTMAQLSTAVSDGDPAYVGAANTFTTGQIISSTTSLLLGTAGSAVGNVGFNNATSGTTTLAPATGALGTGTVTLPLSGTLAISSGAQTFTGVQSMTSPDITTSITTPSTTFALVDATATTVNFAGAATTLNIGNTSGATSLLGTLNAQKTSTTANVKPLLRQTFSDAAANITAGNNYIAQIGTMSANRTLTLPAANEVQAGSSITVVDESGTAAYNKYIAVTRAGSDTIIGGFSSTTEIVISGASRTFTSNGASKWFIHGIGSFAEVVGLSIVNSGSKRLDFTSSPLLGNYFRVYSPVANVLSFAATSDGSVCKLTFSSADSSGCSAIANSGTTLTFGIGGSGASAANGGTVNFTGTIAVTGATTLTGNLTSNGALISTPQALSGNGAVAAVNLTTLTTTIANTGTANTTTTLAAGTNGQTKIISFITDGGFDAVVTVTNPAWGGAGTITMNDALDNVLLIYLNSVWQVFINNGCTLA